MLDRINGHPGGYVRIAGKWRLEEVRHTQSIPLRCLRVLNVLPFGLKHISPSPFAVPSQRLPHRPLHPNGHHNGAQANHQQRL